VTRLDDKLARHRAGAGTARDFIIADAKDADMGFGTTAPGPQRDAQGRPGAGYKPLPAYLAQIEQVIAQDLVDIMLTSVSNYERLTARDAFRRSAIQPAVRLNDTSDIWNNRGGRYRAQTPLPFRSPRLESVRRLGCGLGLYAVTFCNDAEADRHTLEAFRAFRADAEANGLRYFLEVFNPNVETGIDERELGAFVNDWIVRCLAGVAAAERPAFLKIAYNGARATAELAAYDPDLVVGILGGGAGTTRDALLLLREAADHGARVALYGRKINLAESPLDMIRMLRAVADHELTPDEGVRAYHDALNRQGIVPQRALDADLEVTDPVLRADGHR